MNEFRDKELYISRQQQSHQLTKLLDLLVDSSNLIGVNTVTREKRLVVVWSSSSFDSTISITLVFPSYLWRPPAPNPSSPMGSNTPPSRAALEPFATLDPAALAGLPVSSPLTVRSAAISSPYLYLGTGGGKLLLFTLDSPSPDFLRLLPIGPTRPVSAILPLPAVARLLLLADGLLLLADPLLSRPVRRLGSVRNVAAVAARASESDDDRPSCSLAVSVGKKLLLVDLTLHDADELEVRTRDIALVDGVKALAWVGDSVFVGTASGYSLFSTTNAQGGDIFTLPESSRPPRVKPLSGGDEVMLLVDNVGVVVDRSGHPVGSSFVFNTTPDCIAEVYPYVVVAGDSKVDVYRRKNGAHLQAIPFARPGTGGLIVASEDAGIGSDVVVIATAYKVT